MVVFPRASLVALVSLLAGLPAMRRKAGEDVKFANDASAKRETVGRGAQDVEESSDVSELGALVLDAEANNDIGWYLGEMGNSCDETCRGAGLSCDVQSFRTYYSMVEGRDEMGAIVEQLGAQCDNDYLVLEGGETVPFIQEGKCRWPPSGGDTSALTCSGSASKAERLCFCSAQEIGWYLGETGNNCDETCRDAGLSCDVQSFRTHYSMVEGPGEMGAIVEQLGAQCSDGYKQLTGETVPFIQDGKCRWPPSGGNTALTCSGSAAKAERLCYCDAQA